MCAIPVSVLLRAMHWSELCHFSSPAVLPQGDWCARRPFRVTPLVDVLPLPLHYGFICSSHGGAQRGWKLPREEGRALCSHDPFRPAQRQVRHRIHTLSSHARELDAPTRPPGLLAVRSLALSCSKTKAEVLHTHCSLFAASVPTNPDIPRRSLHGFTAWPYRTLSLQRE